MKKNNRTVSVQRMKQKVGFLSLLCHILYFQGSRAYVYSGGSTSWEDWWTYDGISGPDFWGLLNLEWSLCSKGRRQSPVNVDPAGLLFDPSLRPLHVDKIRVNGVITNTGHGVIFRTTPQTHAEILNITGGPLSYKYRFSEIHIHFARSDEKGSEHLISGYQFPAELQIYGYNSDLYQNISEAMALQKNQGLVGISILMQTGDLSNPELRIITSQLHKIVHRGQEAQLKYLSLRDLLPETPYYMTYEGSTTMPGCYETVTWIVMNKPIYITKQQLYALRRLMQGDERNPKAPLADNFRPTLDLNQRTIRTNIDFKRSPHLGVLNCNCGIHMERRKQLTLRTAKKDRDKFPTQTPLQNKDEKRAGLFYISVEKFCSKIILPGAIIIKCAELVPQTSFSNYTIKLNPVNHCSSSFTCAVARAFLSIRTGVTMVYLFLASNCFAGIKKTLYFLYYLFDCFLKVNFIVNTY